MVSGLNLLMIFHSCIKWENIMSLRGFRFCGFLRILVLFIHFEFERKVSLSNFMSFHKNVRKTTKPLSIFPKQDLQENERYYSNNSSINIKLRFLWPQFHYHISQSDSRNEIDLIKGQNIKIKNL